MKRKSFQKYNWDKVSNNSGFNEDGDGKEQLNMDQDQKSVDVFSKLS